MLAGSSEAITVRIFGPDLDTLRDKAAAVHKALAGIKGVVDLRTELQVDVPHIRVVPNLASRARYGLKPGDIRRQAATIVASEEVSDLHGTARCTTYRLERARRRATDVQSIRDLPLDTPGGGHVRLADVAKVYVGSTPNQITREDNSRRIDVGMNVRAATSASVVADVEDRLDEGEHAARVPRRGAGRVRRARGRPGPAVRLRPRAPRSASSCSCRRAFGSWRVATCLVPDAAAGAGRRPAGGVRWRAACISLGSLVGFLTVFGIAARNGILLINHYQHLEREEGEEFGAGLVLRGSRERLAPILMTALATGLALVPLVVAGEIPGHEIEYPMAIVILGGLVTSTLLNLFLVPTLYLRTRKA